MPISNHAISTAVHFQRVPHCSSHAACDTALRRGSRETGGQRTLDFFMSIYGAKEDPSRRRRLRAALGALPHRAIGAS
jgi:hypothetical protein